MNSLEPVNWELVTFSELDMILRISGFLDESYIDSELSISLTPLCLACKYNREDLVTVLLHHNAQVNKSSSYYNRLPLHFACNHNQGNVGLVRKIIEAKANLNASDSIGNTSLHIACAKSNIPVVKLLIKNGASVNIKNMKGDTPLVRACITQCIEIVEILIKAGCDTNIPDGLPLEIAIQVSSVEILRLLIEGGANLHEGPYISQACERGDIESMKILHRHGADVNKTNKLGMSPLQIACFSVRPQQEVVRLLLKWGANIHASSHMRATALHFACHTHDIVKIRLLLAYGADVNAQDSLQFSPLMMAIQNFSQQSHESLLNSVVVIRLLLAAGTKLKKDNFERVKSMILFVQERKEELVNLLYLCVSQPADLQALCRVSIRRHVRPDIDQNMDVLPLPAQVIRYLKFLDILDSS